MSCLMASIGEFLRSEDGITAVEYAVLLTLIAVICVAGLGIFIDPNAVQRLR